MVYHWKHRWNIYKGFIDAIVPTKVKAASSEKKKLHAEISCSANKLNVDGERQISMYKDRLCIYNLKLKNARQSFFCEIIAKNHNNAHSLFVTVSRSTNPPVSVTCEFLSTGACIKFVLFFTDKIQNIRQ